MKYIKAFVLPLFTFDLRSISLLRIGVGLALLIDLIIRFYNLEAHYTDYGVLPLEALFRLSWNEYFFSIHAMSGLPLFQALIFLLNLVCIVSLLVGYRTKLFTILCWIFLISLHNRNPLIHQGGDDLLRLLVFWGMFLPWNYYYSIDAQRNEDVKKPVSFFSIACFGLMLQVGYVYFFSALLKSSSEWTSEYSALYYALSLDQIVMPVGRLIYPFEGFLKVSTMMVYYIELILPITLLIPVYTKFFRSAFVVIITMLHVGIVLCLNVGLFPLVGIVSLIVLLPGSFTIRIIEYFKRLKIYNFTGSSKFIASYIKNKYSYNPTESYWVKPIVAFFIIYAFNWNLMTIRRPNMISYIGKPIAYATRVDQHWGMFSPSVFKDDGWFVFSAKDNSEKVVDILQSGKQVSFQKLASVPAPLREDRWRKYSENILLISNSKFRLYYCSYLMNQWNDHQSTDATKINSLQLIYMKEISLPGYKVKGPSKEVLCECNVLR
jgi:hypothetical protein